MNKNSVVASLIGIVVVTGIALGAVYLGSESTIKTTSSPSSSPTSKATTTPVATVTSDDGLATLTIPSGALSETSKLKKIKITRTYKQKTDTGEKISGDQADADLIGYKLEPDGLKFNKPVIFKTTINRVMDGLPFLLHFSNKNKKVELVKDLEIGIDIAKKKTSVSAPIKHFSNLVLTDSRIEVRKTEAGEKVKVSLTDLGDREARPLDIEVIAPDTFVDEFIPTTIIVRENNSPFFIEEITWPEDGIVYTGIEEYRIEPGSVHFYGSVRPSGASGSVAPRQQPPRDNTLLGRFTIRINDHFRCAKKGTKNHMEYRFRATAGIEQTSWVVESPETKDRTLERVSWTGFVRGNSFSCLKEHPETDMSFEHTEPGAYSTVFLDITGEPGATVEATLIGPAVAGTPTREIILESDGTGQIQWQINQFGTYLVSGSVDGEKISDSVTVK